MQLGWIASFIFVSVTNIFCFSAQAAPKKFELSPAQVERIREQHQSLNWQLQPWRDQEPPARPFSELEEAGYFFMSTDYDFDSLEAKQTMARHLPEGVTLILYTSPGADKQEILRDYQNIIAPERVKVVELAHSERGFWARDGLPVPTWSKQGLMELVDARYYHYFEPDQVIAGWFKSHLRHHEYYFEGGNFMTNDQGDCLMVNNDLSESIPDALFKQTYGCTRLIRLPFEKGIGHVDESVRFLGSNSVVTDSAKYEALLAAKGYNVRMLPRPQNRLETYVNSLLVNGTVFVPIYNQAKDELALDVYRSYGLNVVGIATNELSNTGMGSLHCITMTYPKVPFQALLKAINGKEL